MPNLSNPHDHFFKAVFSRPEVAGDFLRCYLPADVAEVMELNSLTISKDSFIDQDLREHYSDLLYEVRLRDGQHGYVYVLFEHMSYPEPRIGLDPLRYLVRIWEQWLKADHGKRLPVILPVVVYHGRSAWQIATDFAALVEASEALLPFVPNFRYPLIDLSAYPDEVIRGEIILRTALLVLKYIFRDDLRKRLPEILSRTYAKERFFVIPAEAGIHSVQQVTGFPLMRE